MARSIKKLTHFDARGAVHMVDVGAKDVTHRIAVASGRIAMQASTLKMIAAGRAKKGDVLGVARLAAIQLALSRVAVDCELVQRPAAVRVVARVECHGPTGVEMEALTAVAVGLLTVYDMVKAVDRGMSIGEIVLEEKSGGRSGVFRRAAR
jgi:cyclic pyranopterin phosphate synthase